MPPRKSTGSSQSRQSPCRTCHNLDPRGQLGSTYNTESSEKAHAKLSLVLDALRLSRTPKASKGGCRFCNALCQALDVFADGWRDTRQRINVDMKERGTVRVGLDQKRWQGELIEVYNAKPSRSWPTLGSAHRIPLRSGSDDTFDFARKCIQDCLTSKRHGACSIPRISNKSVPKRLLDVGRITAPIRLIETQGNAYDYVALSHCWGTGSPLKATKANWKKLSHEIPFDILPPLFQDAIIITRQLGMRYIWIDSLCIIQDSTRDWETASSKMGSTYEDSYVTISATGSSDGSVCCLRDREAPTKIKFQNISGQDLEIRARRVENHHPRNKNEEPARLIGPLTTRAWALQEHVLSTRVLHYTASELVFECKTSFRCECSPSRKVSSTTPSLIPKAVAKMRIRPEAIWDAWHRLLEQYSVRNLTIHNDKLPAISGIASKIQQATDSPYIAGLWEDNIAFDLLWSTSAASMPEAHYFALDTFRAPTFSWASLDTPIVYPSPDEDECGTAAPAISLISSSTTIDGLNPLGAISYGSILVSGPVLQATLHATQGEGLWAYHLLIKGTSAITIQHDCLLVEDVAPGPLSHTIQTVRRAQCGDVPRPFQVPVLCLGVVRYDAWMTGLVLGLQNHRPNRWNRLGTFSAGSEAFRPAKVEEVELV